MFPEKTVEEIEETTSADCIMTPKSSMAFFLEGLQDNDRASDFSQVEKRKLWNALSKFYLTDSEWKPETEKLLKTAYEVHSDEPISHAVTQALYGTVLENSVTRLERFAACAYAHYLNYGSSLQAWTWEIFTMMRLNIFPDVWKNQSTPGLTSRRMCRRHL